MEYQLITETKTLEAVCAKARQCDAVALDTEFVRTRTLTPQLGLLQLYDGEQLILIDPIAIDDMSAFVELMQDPSVIKVLHSCSEDLETFLAAFDVLPEPVFDTQFAASVLGMGATLGYARLVEELSGVTLDKGESRTDWIARPLRESQLVYAANDVLYLLPAYRVLAEKIDDAGKFPWITEEIRVLGQKKKAQLPLDQAYLSFKNTWRLSVQQLTVLRHLAGWRLKIAREKDLALNFVVKEGQLFEIAQKMPDSRSALSRITDIQPQTMRKYSDVLLTLVSEARELYQDSTSSQRLSSVKRLIDYPEYKKTLSAIKAICDDVAKQNNVPEEVVSSKKQINQLIKWWWFDTDDTRAQGLKPDLLSGWRQPLLEKPIRDLLGERPVADQ